MLSSIALPNEAQTKTSVENEQAIRALVIELARDIEDPDDILSRYSISKEEFDNLARTRVFQTMLDQAIKEWNSATNTAERVKIKAQNLIEEALPFMFAQLKNDTNTLTSRADLFGRLARIGALGNAPVGNQGSGETFKININLGEDKNITIEHVLPTKVIDGDYEEL